MSEIKKYWFPSGVYSFLQNAVLLISGITGFVLLVRFFTKSDFGAWALYLAVTTFADVTRGGIVNNALIKYGTPSGNTEYKKILSASFSIQVAITLAVIFTIILLAPLLGKFWNSEEFYNLLILYPIYAVCQIPHMFMSAVERTRFHFKGQYYSNLIRNFVFIGTIAYFTIISKTLTLSHLPVIQSVSVLFAGGVIYYYTKDYLSFEKKIDWSWIKKLFNFGKYVFGSNVISILFTNIDQIMLGYYFNPSYVAVYNTAMRIGNFSDIPMTSVATIVYPKSAQRLEEIGHQSLRHLYERSVGIIMAFVLPGIILLSLFAKNIVLILATSKYHDTIPVIYIILLFSLFKPFIRYFGLAMDTLGKPNINFWTVITLLCFNFILNLFLIPLFSLMGAATASLLSLFLGLLITHRILKTTLDVRFSRIVKYMLNFYLEGLKFIVFFNEYKITLDEADKTIKTD